MKNKCLKLITKNKDAVIYYGLFALTGLFVGAVFGIMIFLVGFIVKLFWR